MGLLKKIAVALGADEDTSVADEAAEELAREAKKRKQNDEGSEE